MFKSFLFLFHTDIPSPVTSIRSRAQIETLGFASGGVRNPTERISRTRHSRICIEFRLPGLSESFLFLEGGLDHVFGFKVGEFD